MCGVYTQQYDSKILVREEKNGYEEILCKNDDDLVVGGNIQLIATTFEYSDIPLDIQFPHLSDDG